MGLDLIVYSTRCALYDEYCKELSKFDPDIYPSREEVSRWCNGYLDNGYTWLDITIADRTIGFVIIAEKGKTDENHKQFDFFIEQTYILPDYRRHGFVFNVLKKFTEKHKGKYGLVVLQKNFRAQDYWKSTFARLGGYQVVVDLSKEILYKNEILWGFELK